MKVTYEKFEDYPLNVPTLKRVSKKLEELIEELKECGSFKTANSVYKKWNKYTSQLETDMSVIMVRYTTDVNNIAYKRAQEKVDEISPIISNYRINFFKILLKAKYRKDFEKAYGKYLFKMMENAVKSFDEKIIDDLVTENKLSSEYDRIKGSATVIFRGEEYSLTQMGKFLTSADRETRKEAAIVCDKWYLDHNEELGEVYSKLVSVRTTMAKKLGFKNFIELGYLRLGRTDYDARMVKKYRAQIAECVVPLAQNLYKKQMKLLGIKNPMYYDYNLSFKSGNAKPVGNTEYLVNAAKEMYHSLSPLSGEFFDFMLSHHLLDLEARKGKAPGGYCTTFPSYKAPFIFSNFNGTEDDVNTLTHEGGHAFQAYLCTNIKVPEYVNPTLEACEIHSMSMEFFAWPYMDKFFENDANKAKYAHLMSAITFLPYGILIDEFQHWVYEHPEATHQQRCQEFRNIEKRYLPHKKYDDCPCNELGGWWLRQSHIFSTPFYYIDYTLAQVCAFQFLVEDRKNHDKAWKKYVKLCKCGGKYPFVALLEKNHIKNPFIEGNVKKAIKPLEKILKSFSVEKF